MRDPPRSANLDAIRASRPGAGGNTLGRHPGRDRGRHRHRGRYAAALATALALTLACQNTSPIQVRRVSARQVHEALTASAIASSQPSPFTTQALHREDLLDGYADHPDDTLAELRVLLLEKEDPTDLIFALAELQFLRGKRIGRGRDGRPHFLAAAVYALGFLSLLGQDPANAMDPRFRVAVDLYNRGLTLGLMDDDGEYVVLTPGPRTLPYGELRIEADPAEFLWGGYRLERFVPVAEIEVRGLANRFRRAGLGAPLAASVTPADVAQPPAGHDRIATELKVPATAILAFGDWREGLSEGRVEAELVIFTMDESTSIDVGETSIPLEYEHSAALAFGLARSSVWEFERRGFFSGDFGRGENTGVHLLAPYDPERIPVVLIHGTASSPGRWADMLNDLQADSLLLDRYQFWIYQYNTGNPIPYSAGLLARRLTALVEELDPDGDDEALRRMVLVGHSQGGLLARLMVVDSGDVFWREVSSVPIEKLDLRPASREILEQSLFFEPLPFVQTVVFLATPHRGSFLAERRMARFASSLVTLPQELGEMVSDLVAADDDRVLLRTLNDMPSAVDDMRPDAPFLQNLEAMEIAPDVDTHSIIAVLPGQDLETGNDGVVTFESQRLRGVRSQLVVRFGHSVQGHPRAIGEVRRILREHLRDE